MELSMPKNNVGEDLRRFNLSRDQILARLWEIANLDPEMTRGSASAQIKALSLIVAIEGLIANRLSDRRTASPQNKPAPPPVHAEFHTSASSRAHQHVESVDPQPPPAPTHQEDAPANRSQTASLLPRIPIDYFALDTSVPLSIKRNPFVRHR
jgi:hypothetical protein